MDYADFEADYAEPFPEYGVAPALVPAPQQQPRGAAEAPEPGPPEHGSIMTQGPINDVYGPAPMTPPAPAPHGMPMHAQAVGAMPQAGGSKLALIGAAVLAAGYVGHRYGGWAGAGAGVLGAGAAINAVRALRGYRDGTDAGKKEGRVSAFYSLVGAGAGAVVWHRYADKQPLRKNPTRETDPFGSPCDIRPVGP